MYDLKLNTGNRTKYLTLHLNSEVCVNYYPATWNRSQKAGSLAPSWQVLFTVKKEVHITGHMLVKAPYACLPFQAATASCEEHPAHQVSRLRSACQSYEMTNCSAEVQLYLRRWLSLLQQAVRLTAFCSFDYQMFFIKVTLNITHLKSWIIDWSYFNNLLNG